jgi:hypothetical protein
MQGVLIDDHRIHVDFSQSVREAPPRYTVADGMSRFLSSLTLGEIQRTQRERSVLEDSEAYQA